MTLRLPLRILSVVFATLLFALTAAPLLHADTVVLKNGDRLTGTAIKLDGGKLTFKTAYADAILIAWDQVTSLTTSQPLVLHAAKETLTVTAKPMSYGITDQPDSWLGGLRPKIL